MHEGGEKIEMARALRRKYNAQIVLKSAQTLIAGSDNKIWKNTTGKSGLATAGSGDVLTGVIAALLAQGCTPLTAAKLGVYVHGLAGELASAEYTEYGVRAGLVSAFLAPALKSLT
jgi:NAD(P)H-hydrate epimerase